jgi:hypothetical protein
MLKFQSRLGIPVAYLELFQIVITFNGMPGVLYPAAANPRAYDRACALRVGIGEHCRHSQWAFKSPISRDLRIWYAQTPCSIGHTRMLGRCMLEYKPALSMQLAYLALSQLFIFSNSMVSIHHPPIRNRHRACARAPARALRVGMEVIAQHATWALNPGISKALRTLHAETLGDAQHVTRCHPVRNLLVSVPKSSVPPSL